ncbi:MAG: (Na+)-NQR maturation NqrM [Gammaproteobacteria bacterium]|nr:(Na+)-NQR maturation NqrM [Gammaproteobacteria bacterium]
MTQFLVVFVIMLGLVAAMSIGVIMGRKPIAGTCGGLNMMGADGSCEICGGDSTKCEAADDAAEAKGELGYDATRR